ncbi:MAG: NADH-quinone oxidoreductase subunit L [Polyangiales bacterium]
MRNLLNPVDFGNLLTAAPGGYSVLGWIVALPLIGAIINGIWGRKVGRQGVYIAGIAAVGTSFLLSLLAFAALLKSGHAPSGEGAGEGAEAAHHALRALSYKAWDWFPAPVGRIDGGAIRVGTETIAMRWVLDPLSGVMLLVVTGVGTLIHVYSAGYMSHYEGYDRFYAYLNLFIFAMLNLILGDSIVLMFLGWEGVGLASYLLIGFWYENRDYAFAGRKAFIVNRIGDAGLILGMTIIAWRGGTYSFEVLRGHMTHARPFIDALNEHTHLGEFLVDMLRLGGSEGVAAAVGRLDFTWGGLACLLLFVGCAGKSAQIPLYVWLPDAMAGPTPVSALIHAATMVTAGIYLLCRLSFLFLDHPTVLSIIALTGAATALFAATIAVTQVELKKVLAYSTVSQLGFMFMGCGVGAFTAGFFHVFTHAFFKACLFLGAGAVMHACRDKQDIRELGGLRKYLPVTAFTFAVSTAAIIGFPGLSGFFSKDEILWRAFTSPLGVGKVVFVMGWLAAILTAFYMCRLFILTFMGEGPRYLLAEAHGAAVDVDHRDHHQGGHPDGDEPHGHDDHGDEDHDHGHGHGHGPPSEHGTDMKLLTTPLIVLAAMAAVAGFLGLPYAFTHKEGVLAAFLEPAVGDAFVRYGHAVMEDAHKQELLTMALGVLAFLVGTGAAWWVYIAQEGKPADMVSERVPGLYRLVCDKWRIDELYDKTFVRGAKLSAGFAAGFDRYVIDGLVNLTGIVAMALGRVVKPLQTGAVQVYGALIGVGALGLVAWVTLMPAAAITYTASEGGRTVLQASGGLGYTYRWAFFDMRESGDENTLAARCPMDAAEAALSRAEAPTAETRREESITRPRCAALQAESPFGRRVTTTALVVPAGLEANAANGH